MSIKRLPGDVAAQLKSSAEVTSLNSVVCGLVKNALDANASRVDISVDYRRGGCSVDDNGEGIPAAEFGKEGGLGKPNYTSKHEPRPDQYGRSGTFLASVAALSLLSIVSRRRLHGSHNSLTIHQSDVIARSRPALSEQSQSDFSHGTKVVVRDLFGSMPVRVKHRALEMERSGYSKDLERLASTLVSLIVVWPGEVSVSLRDADGRHVLSLRTAALEGQRGLSQGPADVQRILSRTPRLLAQASLFDGAGRDMWVPLAASSTGISIGGCVCLQPVATKRLQFVTIGLEPVSSDPRSSLLHDEVNRVFADSAFGAIDKDGDLEGGRATKKGVDRWPIYYLKICLGGGPSAPKTDLEDLLGGSAPTLTVLTDLLRAMSYAFLKKHGFRPNPALTSVRSTSPISKVESPSTDRSSTQQSPTRSGSAPRSGGGRRRGAPVGTSRDASISPSKPAKSAVRVLGRSLSSRKGTILPTTSSPRKRVPRILLREPSEGDVGNARRERKLSPDTTLRNPHPRAETDRGPRQRNETITWPVSMSDLETSLGNHSKLSAECIGRPKTWASSPTSAGFEMGSPSPAGAWLRDAALSTWEDSAFASQEKRIPVVSGLLLSGASGIDGTNSGPEGAHEDLSMELLSRISARALREAEVIGQVDSKFVLIKVQPDSPDSKSGLSETGICLKSLLVLVDQHAADERCRVESLMKAYFTDRECSPVARVEALEKPLTFELSEEEGRLLWRHRKHLESWGILFAVAMASGNQDYCSQPSESGCFRVEVRSLPPSILERCRLEPRLLIELVRREIWARDEESGLHQAARDDVSGGGAVDLDWVRRFHDCPRGILDLINSRACRSAIMFNDRLTLEQCHQLVGRLAECAFPFQCAHGRPSMIPLVDLGDYRDTGCAGSGGFMPRLKASACGNHT